MDRRAANAERTPAATLPPVFPTAGARARRIKRFERDLEDWLARPEGRFAQWRARRRMAPAEPQGVVSQ